ncbi:MAG: hypothetical protein H5T83_03820 [Actinotalea sp.]|nr:hypothetical protein [Actinotalea sp.]
MPVGPPIAGSLANGFLGVVLGLVALLVVGLAPLPGAAANLLALVAVVVVVAGVWSLWVALHTIGSRSDRAAGHDAREPWWSGL